MHDSEPRSTTVYRPIFRVQPNRLGTRLATFALFAGFRVIINACGAA